MASCTAKRVTQCSDSVFTIGETFARISEALGLQWRDIFWDRALASIRQTLVHGEIQDGAKTGSRRWQRAVLFRTRAVEARTAKRKYPRPQETEPHNPSPG